ncbi:hypothetical protein HDU87_003705 [Geranomyces variabilis]|uniref:RRM domain-containing protein n=1 Tax=Geranomyces variabilis TaxID=109894 RepID=A0AAD5TJ94_9FUNG|nr:hypothetical protein HDU87_003705 [Geranomyces variabilis]
MATGSATTAPASGGNHDPHATTTADWEDGDAAYYEEDAGNEDEQWNQGAGDDNTAKETYDADAAGGGEDEDWDYYEEDYGGEEGLDPDAAVDAGTTATQDNTTTTTTTMFDGLLEDGVKIGREGSKAEAKPSLSPASPMQQQQQRQQQQQKPDPLPQRPQPAPTLPALPARPHPPPPQQHQQQHHPHAAAAAPYRAHAPPNASRPAGGYMPPQARYDQFRPYGNRPPLPFHGGAKIHVNPKFAAAAATGRFHPYAATAPLPGAGAHHHGGDDHHRHHHHHHAATMHAYPQQHALPGMRGGGGGGGGGGAGMTKGGLLPRGATAHGQQQQPPHNRIYPPPQPPPTSASAPQPPPTSASAPQPPAPLPPSSFSSSLLIPQEQQQQPPRARLPPSTSITSRLDHPPPRARGSGGGGGGGVSSSGGGGIILKALSRATIRNLAPTATGDEIRVAVGNAGIAVTSVQISSNDDDGGDATKQAEIAFATSDGAKVFRRMFHKTDLCGSRVEVAVLP